MNASFYAIMVSFAGLVSHVRTDCHVMSGIWQLMLRLLAGSGKTMLCSERKGVAA